MLAAEFGYREDWVDRHMTLDKFFAHMEYRLHTPPIGALFKAFLVGMGGEKAAESAQPTPLTNEKKQYSTREEVEAALRGMMG